MLQEPEQGLPNTAQIEKLTKHQLQGLLHATIRVLLQTLIALQVAYRDRRDELATLGLLTARLQ